MADRVRVAYTLLQCWHRVPGGTATSILALAAALSRRDDVDLVGVGPWNRKLPAAPFTPSIPVRHLPAPYQAIYDIWHHSSLFGPELVTGPVDVVHATAATVPPRRRSPLVVTVHDLFPLLAPAQFTKRGVRILTRGAELARTRADLVCCPSRATFDDCVAAGFAPERLRVVPWGAERREVGAEDRARVRATYSLDRPYVMWVGTVEPRKNLPVLLEAFRRAELADEELVLVGPVGWHEQLEGHLEGIGDRVRRLGFVPAEDLPALYAEADLFCLPSLREGFGLPALDAMAQGTPVIGSSGSAIEEVVGDAGLVVAPNDVTGWAEAMRTVLHDEALSTRLAHAGQQRSEKFTWERSAQLMADAYREVTS